MINNKKDDKDLLNNTEKIIPDEENKTGGSDARSENKLGTAPVGKLIAKLAIPAIAAQIVNVLYNIVDRIYIGHIEGVGASALTGLGVCFPVLILIASFSALIGAGGAPLAAIRLGQRDRDGAEKILGNATVVLIMLSAVLTTVFMIFKNPILMAFGASADTIVYADEYLNIYLIGTVFVQLALGLNMFITTQGRAATAMMSVLIGAVLNIALDPLFIFAFNMGVRGAALATIISQAVSAAWVVRFLLSKKSVIRIKRSNMRFNTRIVGSICALGVSPFIMQATECVVAVTFNSGLQRYGGDMYVGAMTILQSVMQLVVVPVSGLTQGTQPIISYNYGACNASRIKDTFKRVLFICVAITTSMCLLTVLFPTVFASMFTDDAALIALCGKVMPIYMAGIWLFGVQMACQSSFVGMGRAKISLFLALLRKVILLIPLAIILPVFIGVEGIFIAEPISDIAASLTTGTMFLFAYKKLDADIGRYA